MTTTVTALLVSHDGARWLPAVLDGLEAQTRHPDRVVALDTGSSDGSPDLVARRLAPAPVHHLPASTGYGQAIAEGLARTPATGADEWVWLLHDDSAPAPDALAVLLAAAESHPEVDVLGAKHREWPSLRRLLEVGVTLSATGRRETGLERGEYDQGQHDRPREVLAVNTAGMLVRRSVLEQLGLDPLLPVLGADLDLGWRAARAGHRTLVVPAAVVFHVEASHRGVRRTPLTGRHRRTERAAALYTLLANGPAASLPARWVRLLLGSLLRSVGLLLVRAPGEAADEVMALLSVYARPDRVLAARRRRRGSARVPHREVRPLLAPYWMPYRHGLDFATDVGAALAHQAADLTVARSTGPRAGAAGAAETGPVPAEAENLPEDSGLLARTVRSPTAAVALGLVLVALWAARDLVGAGALAGGALLPAPAGASEWWRTYLASSHDLGTGSAAPAAPYVLPLAVAGSLLLGKAWLVVDLLLLLGVPLAAVGAWRLLLRLTRSRPAALWGAVSYGLLPVLGGAVQQGRLGTVAVLLVLPWLAHAALSLDLSQDRDRRQRAAWRTALWLALAAAFAPVAWLLATALLLVGTVLLALTDRRWRRPSAWWPLALPVLVAPVLLLPWSALVWSQQGAAAWLTEAGLSAPGLLAPLTWTDVVTGRPGAGAPGWLSAGVVLAAVAALAAGDRRRPVLAAWTVVVVALAATAALAPLQVSLAREPQPHPVWLGVPLLVAQAAGICAAAVAGAGIRGRLTGTSFGWRQPVGGLVAALALAAPVAGTVWWAVSGSDGALQRRPASRVPAYMADAAAADPNEGVLLVRGGPVRGYTYLLLRGPGLRLGEESVLPAVADQADLTGLVGRLVTGPRPDDPAVLRDLGAGFVYAPAPADPRLAATLDSASGFTQGSAAQPDARAWQVDAGDGPDAAALASASDPSSAARPWLLAGQLLALLVAGVLAAPTRRSVR